VRFRLYPWDPHLIGFELTLVRSEFGKRPISIRIRFLGWYINVRKSET